MGFRKSHPDREGKSYDSDYTPEERRRYRHQKKEAGQDAFSEADLGRKQTDRLVAQIRTRMEQIRDEGVEVDETFAEAVLEDLTDYEKTKGRQQGYLKIFRNHKRDLERLLRQHVSGEHSERLQELMGEIIGEGPAEIPPAQDAPGAPAEGDRDEDPNEGDDADDRDDIDDDGDDEDGDEGGAGGGGDVGGRTSSGSGSGSGSHSASRVEHTAGGVTVDVDNQANNEGVTVNVTVPEGREAADEEDEGDEERLEEERKQREELEGILESGTEELGKYKDEVEQLKKELEPVDTVPGVADGQLTFAIELGALDASVAELEAIHAEIKEDIEKSPPPSVSEIQREVDDLKEKIEKAREKFQDYRDLRAEAERVGTVVGDYYKNEVQPIASDPLYQAQEAGALKPEAEFLKQAREGLDAEIEAFNDPNNTLEEQKEALKNLEEKVAEYTKQTDAIKQVLGKLEAVDQAQQLRLTENDQVVLRMKDLEKLGAETPSAWSWEALWGGQKRAAQPNKPMVSIIDPWGIGAGIGNMYDQVRENFYNARFFGAGNVPEYNFRPERAYIESLSGQIEQLMEAFEQAKTPEERLQALTDLEVRISTMNGDGQLKASIEKTNKATQVAERAGHHLRDSYVGRAVSILGGNLDEVARTDWARGHGIGNIPRFGAQYMLGGMALVEDITKWGVGVVAGATIGAPVTGIRSLASIPEVFRQGSMKPMEDAFDDNAFTATMKTVTYDLGKAVIGGIGAGVGALWNGATGKGFTRPKWTDAWVGTERNNLTRAGYYIGKGFGDLLNPSSENFGNGYQLGRYLGGSILAIGGGLGSMGTASGIAGTVLEQQDREDENDPSGNADLDDARRRLGLLS